MMSGAVDGGAPAVETVGIGKNYGPVQALKSVDLKIASGEYFVLLGAAGARPRCCG